MDSIDKIVNVDIENEMKKSYIEYAMSVIVSRALPDVRDGFKPVHRRILYAMNELNLDPNKPYKKSARIVGDTMGKYHPHGDSSIYDAMVRMAQDFSMRYMLVDGHGNFGNIDGDGAAASRYTEARLSKISVHMLSDIEKNTVDFVPNYTEEFNEPSVLPSRFPNLLVNGSSGIAVGMSTNIPPHNLKEIIDAVVKVIDNHIEENRETDVEEIIKIVKGPDFPTAANILGTQGIKSVYRTGRGKIRIRANTFIETTSNNREYIIVDELPYQVNKARLLEKIAELVKNKKIEGISDLRDESDRVGMRIVIEIKKDANANVILNQLFKFTQLQETFGCIMLALVKNEPKVLNLLEIITHYINHQKDVVTRRSEFDLNKALKRDHILQGFIIALDFIDEVIKIIRGSKDTSTAKENLMERFKFSEPQVTAIVEMRLRSLTGLERDKIEKELAELKLLIAELTAILANENKLYSVIKEELLIIKNKFGDDRRTKIIIDEGEIDIEDLIDEEMNVITMTHLNYIKRLPLDTYKIQNRGGKGIIGMQTRDEDIVSNLFITSTHNYILFFTNLGRVYRIKAYQIPEVGRTARGMAIVNLLSLEPDEKIAAILPVRNFSDDNYLMMVTKLGIVKKTKLSLFGNIRTNGLFAINIRDNDELISVLCTDGKKDVFLATRNGVGIRFNEKSIRSLGRKTSGVRGIRLREEDVVIGAGIIDEHYKILFVCENGYGKCTNSKEFTKQARGGKGNKTHKITEKTGKIVDINFVNDKEEVMLINSNGVIIRIRVCDIATTSRVAQGVKLINLSEDVKVISTAKIFEEDIAIEEIEVIEADVISESDYVEFDDEEIDDIESDDEEQDDEEPDDDIE